MKNSIKRRKKRKKWNKDDLMLKCMVVILVLLLCASVIYIIVNAVRNAIPPASKQLLDLLQTAMSDEEAFLRRVKKAGLAYNDSYQCLYGRFEPDRENVLHIAVTVGDKDSEFEAKLRQQHLPDEPLPYTKLATIEYHRLTLWLVNDSTSSNSTAIADVIANLVAVP